jgi:hypothetical protein
VSHPGGVGVVLEVAREQQPGVLPAHDLAAVGVVGARGAVEVPLADVPQHLDQVVGLEELPDQPVVLHVVAVVPPVAVLLVARAVVGRRHPHLDQVVERPHRPLLDRERPGLLQVGREAEQEADVLGHVGDPRGGVALGVRERVGRHVASLVRMNRPTKLLENLVFVKVLSVVNDNARAFGPGRYGLGEAE